MFLFLGWQKFSEILCINKIILSLGQQILHEVKETKDSVLS